MLFNRFCINVFALIVYSLVTVHASTSMWVWNTAEILSDPLLIQGQQLVSEMSLIKVTDLYFYMSPGMYSTYKTGVSAFIQKASFAGMRVWALDGDRSYIPNPQLLYTGLNNLISYNAAALPTAKFYGFSADIEPQDTGVYNNFTNGVPTSQLTSDQASQRNTLMQQWITVHSGAQSLLTPKGLQFGAVMPFWLLNYYNEPINTTWPSSTSTNQCVMNYMMPLMSQYIVTGYNTDPKNAAGRVAAQAAYASTYSKSTKVRAGMNVDAGIGATISYADTLLKNAQATVLSDLAVIQSTLAQYSSFDGVCIEDWQGWSTLP